MKRRKGSRIGIKYFKGAYSYFVSSVIVIVIRVPEVEANRRVNRSSRENYLKPKQSRGSQFAFVFRTVNIEHSIRRVPRKSSANFVLSFMETSSDTSDTTYKVKTIKRTHGPYRKISIEIRDPTPEKEKDSTTKKEEDRRGGEQMNMDFKFPKKLPKG